MQPGSYSGLQPSMRNLQSQPATACKQVVSQPTVGHVRHNHRHSARQLLKCLVDAPVAAAAVAGRAQIPRRLLHQLLHSVSGQAARGVHQPSLPQHTAHGCSGLLPLLPPKTLAVAGMEPEGWLKS